MMFSAMGPNDIFFALARIAGWYVDIPLTIDYFLFHPLHLFACLHTCTSCFVLHDYVFQYDDLFPKRCRIRRP